MSRVFICDMCHKIIEDTHYYFDVKKVESLTDYCNLTDATDFDLCANCTHMIIGQLSSFESEKQ